MKHPILLTILMLGFGQVLWSQDTTKSLIDLNKLKVVKKINAVLDSNQKKITSIITKRADSLQSKIKSNVKSVIPKEVEKPLPYETLKNKKYTLTRRAYQNTVSQFNYFFNASEELKELISNARVAFQEDYTELLPFYDYDLSQIAKYNIDSIIYRCNANIVLHDLRSNWVDDAYLLLAKAYFYHKNFDTAGSILQFINYSFYDKDDGADKIMGSNLSTTKGKFSIASADNNRIWENGNVRNESLVWQARNNFELGEINEGMNLLKILQIDYNFPSYLHPFLYEQLAYGYYKSEMYDSAASHLIKGLDNAIDINAKSRWYFLIGQLYDKVKKHKLAYPWYEKASESSLNPILSIYAKINAIHILAAENKEPWIQLASSLEKMTAKEKYRPYSDIIYFEMAKIALENNDRNKATEWLLQSIRKNKANHNQKQRSFEILGDINYKDNHFSIAAKAYDSLLGVLKTQPNYETIQLRKKWLPTINANFKTIALEDSLQYLFSLPVAKQAALSKHIQSYFDNLNKIDKDLFVEKESKKEKDKDISYTSTTPSFNTVTTTENNNRFYFENKNAVTQGSTQFKQKWGDRPNVDNWVRKTSNNIVAIQTKSDNTNAVTQNIQTDGKTKSTTSPTPKDSSTFVLFKDSATYRQSIQKVTDLTYKNASILLFYLNDFDKAYPIYKSIIDQDYNKDITERALLDLASAYIHKGQPQKSDSIIEIVKTKFPKGFYMKRKKDSDDKKNLIDQSTQLYKEAFFLTQIGNWDSLRSFHNAHQSILKNTKWHTPYQFLRVKMYAQQRNDSTAIVLLDSIIFNNQSELIREKAKTIITELKNRKNTEKYLASLVIQKPVTPIETIKEDTAKKNIDTKSVIAKESKFINKDTTATQKIVTKNIIDSSPFTPTFINDSSEPHYIALVMTNVKEMLVKEAQNAFNLFNIDEYKKWNLNASYVQFNEQQHIVWLGPFVDRIASNKYLNAIKPRLKDEIISFIPPKNYELYIFGKANILLIKNKEDLDLYKTFMRKHILK
jgi:hypothetical protein